jgi:carbon-monoxide dehydrogenase medium subunit
LADDAAKIIAGGQTLGPMLNLRLVQPTLIVDVTRIPELVRIEAGQDAVTLGACITHAAIEDGRVEDPTRGLMRRVASGIAYRAVRTRGTIGGSIAHADPAADWLTTFAALGAEVSIAGANSRRTVSIVDFVRGALDTVLAPAEIIDGIRLPRLSTRARTGYYKLCRKTGEFAEAIGAVVHDPDRNVFRAVIGATPGRPIVIASPERLFARPDDWSSFDKPRLKQALRDEGYGGDAYELSLHTTALERAVAAAWRAS